MAEALQIPSWCRPNGWTFYLPDRIVFQSARLQRDRVSGACYLRDCNDVDYSLEECQELARQHLRQPARLVFDGGEASLLPHPQGVLISHRAKKLLIVIPDRAELASEALAQMFNGSTHTEPLSVPTTTHGDDEMHQYRPPTPIAAGDTVIIRGNAFWFQAGSDLLPQDQVPRQYRSAASIPISVLESSLFHALIEVSQVISISSDGQRVKVKSRSGRTSVFRIEDAAVLPKGAA